MCSNENKYQIYFLKRKYFDPLNNNKGIFWIKVLMSKTFLDQNINKDIFVHFL